MYWWLVIGFFENVKSYLEGLVRKAYSVQITFSELCMCEVLNKNGSTGFVIYCY